MAVDRREDPGEFYPDGKVISTRPIAGGGDMKHSDFADVEPLPERFADEDVRRRFNQLVSAAKGASAAIAALLLGTAAFGAGVTVQTAPKGTIYNDEHIVTGVVFNATGLATPEMVTNIVQDVSPAPDFSTNNVELVKTIEAKAPIPTWDTLSGKPTFALVATSGAYSDLSGKPTIPTTAADVGALSINGGTLNGGITVRGDSTFYCNVFSFSDSFKIKFMDAVMTPYFEIFGYDITLPLQSGTLALVSDIPTTMAWSAITGKPTIPSTAADIGALPIDGGTMTGNLVMGYNSLFQINGGGNAKFQFSWGSALDNLIISAYRETSGSYSIRFPTREGLLALTSDIPTSMAWDAITGKPTTISGYGITDALESNFTSLTNNAAFTSAVAAVSPPTDLTHVEAEIETNRTAIATLSARAYIEVVSADEVYYVFTTNQE